MILRMLHCHQVEIFKYVFGIQYCVQNKHYVSLSAHKNKHYVSLSTHICILGASESIFTVSHPDKRL